MNTIDSLQVAYTHVKHRHATNKKGFQCNYLFSLHMRPISWTDWKGNIVSSSITNTFEFRSHQLSLDSGSSQIQSIGSTHFHNLWISFVVLVCEHLVLNWLIKCRHVINRNPKWLFFLRFPSSWPSSQPSYLIRGYIIMHHIVPGVPVNKATLIGQQLSVQPCRRTMNYITQS